MDRIEPYIGMPVILGDSDMQTSGNTAAQGRASSMQEARIISNCTCRSCHMPQPDSPADPETPQVPDTPEIPETNGQDGCQPCLKDKNCDCSTGIPQQIMMPAMAYVPWQKWQQPYDYTKGFETGTIFPDLDLPFSAYQGGRRK